MEYGNGVSKATVLPSNAVILDMDSSKFVWINEDGKAVRRKITVGDFTKGGIVVLSGLNEGDEVIIEGYQKVSDGMNIEVRNVK